MSLKSDIIKYLRENPSHTLKSKKLAKQMRIPEHQYTHFKRALKELLAEGQLFRYSKRKIGIGQKRRTVTGEIQVKSQGYGFLLMENDKEDIYVAENNIGHALNGDRVTVELVKSRRGRIEGRVTDVVKRARTNLVGTYFSGRKTGRFVPDDKKVNREIVIPLDKSKNASDSDKVVIRLDTWDDGALAPTGQVLEILGKPDDPGVDVLSIARSFDLDESFPGKVVAEVREIPRRIPKAEIKRRLDYRNKICFTIDPVDAKDFDDAVSLINLENGNLLLGVHIADVSHYVMPGMKTNAEAMKRGTSVYLVDRVIPMLPEDLSNDQCSLNPGEDKLCFSVLMELDKDANLVNYQIRESLIHSSKRFTYEDIQGIIDGSSRSKKFAPIVTQMFRLSKKLISKRDARGGLDFGSNE
ncbi:MAG: RNB domain-containing ribonuclease, partial [candidate division KSB1 bacterium]|nr:RNB domain-containing ribonuclease [candidate division KSB1 bacterium]